VLFGRQKHKTLWAKRQILSDFFVEIHKSFGFVCFREKKNGFSVEEKMILC